VGVGVVFDPASVQTQGTQPATQWLLK